MRRAARRAMSRSVTFCPASPLPQGFVKSTGPSRAGERVLSSRWRTTLPSRQFLSPVRDRSIVARSDQKVAQQIFNAHPRIDLGEHAGAAGFGIAFSRGIRRNGHSVTKLSLPPASSRKMISAVKFLVVDTGAIRTSAFLHNTRSGIVVDRESNRSFRLECLRATRRAPSIARASIVSDIWMLCGIQYPYWPLSVLTTRACCIWVEPVAQTALLRRREAASRGGEPARRH